VKAVIGLGVGIQSFFRSHSPDGDTKAINYTEQLKVLEFEYPCFLHSTQVTQLNSTGNYGRRCKHLSYPHQ